MRDRCLICETGIVQIISSTPMGCTEVCANCGPHFVAIGVMKELRDGRRLDPVATKAYIDASYNRTDNPYPAISGQTASWEP